MILDQFINYFPYASAQQGSIAYNGQKLILRDVLMNQHEQHEQVIFKLRNIKEADLKSNFKKSRIPCFFVSCYCESNGVGTRSLNDLVYHTGLVTLDLDNCGSNLLEIKKELCKLPQVAYCSKSCSGNGLFAIFRLDDTTKHTECFSEIFPALCQEFGVISSFDSSVKNINRLRFVTFDPDYYINENPKSIRISTRKYYSNNNIINNSTVSSDEIHCRIRKGIAKLIENRIDITDTYDEWIKVGFALADLGEGGREYFHQISALSNKYNFIECDKKFTDLVKYYNGAVKINTLLFLFSKFN
jgi:hypothetical protein